MKGGRDTSDLHLVEEVKGGKWIRGINSDVRLRRYGTLAEKAKRTLSGEER